jgi:hypothetical protein
MRFLQLRSTGRRLRSRGATALSNRSSFHPEGRTVRKVDNMVFGFPDAQTRNLAGRTVRAAGYECFGTGPTELQKAYLLEVHEPMALRRSAIADLVRRTTPTAGRLL